MKLKGFLIKSYYICIIGIQIKEAPPVEYYTLIRELRAIGNNLNQLTVLAYARGFLDAPVLRQQIDCLRETEKEIRKAFL